MLHTRSRSLVTPKPFMRAGRMRRTTPALASLATDRYRDRSPCDGLARLT